MYTLKSTVWRIAEFSNSKTNVRLNKQGQLEYQWEEFTEDTNTPTGNSKWSTEYVNPV